jgi:hypothetical protein
MSCLDISCLNQFFREVKKEIKFEFIINDQHEMSNRMTSQRT